MRTVVVAGVLVMGAALLAGCAPATSLLGSPTPGPGSGSPTPSPSVSVSAVAAEPLEVLCDENLVLTVSSETVVATASGVPLLVTSEAPAGAYLTHNMGGDPLPATPTTWWLTSGPGELTLSCFHDNVEGEPVTVTVVDPAGYWSPTTVADYGCGGSGLLDWALGWAHGSTPEEAVQGVMDAFNEFHGDGELTRMEHARIGYPEAATQTWLVGTEQHSTMSVLVTQVGDGFDAGPDAACELGTWPGSA